MAKVKYLICGGEIKIPDCECNGSEGNVFNVLYIDETVVFTDADNKVADLSQSTVSALQPFFNRDSQPPYNAVSIRIKYGELQGRALFFRDNYMGNGVITSFMTSIHTARVYLVSFSPSKVTMEYVSL